MGNTLMSLVSGRPEAQACNAYDHFQGHEHCYSHQPDIGILKRSPDAVLQPTMSSFAEYGKT